jgi:hypothetical protein
MADLDWLKEALEQTGKEPNTSTGFTPGAHTVTIGLAEGSTDSKDRSIIKVTVIGENEEEGESTLWLHSPGGAKMAIIKVLGILVHNASEDKKATISEFGKRVFGNIKTPAETKDGLLKILNEKLIGKEAFIYAEPQDKYDTTKYVDLWHYLQDKRMPREIAEDVTTTVNNVTPEDVEDAENLFD